VAASGNQAEVVVGDTIDRVPVGEVCAVNYGTIMNQYGTVWTNSNNVVANEDGGVVIENDNAGVIGNNKGIVNSNRGMITLNSDDGAVEQNYATVLTNHGIVTTNNFGATIPQSAGGSTVTTNEGTVSQCRGTVLTNAATGVVTILSVGGGGAGWVMVNDGLVSMIAVGAGISTNNGTVGTNRGIVAINAATGIVTLNDSTGPGIVTDNWGLVVTNNGRVENLMTMSASSGGMMIHPEAFSNPDIANVRLGTAYNFDSAGFVGTLVPVVGSSDGDSQPYAPGKNGRNLSRHNAGMVIAYNDAFSSPNESVGKKAR
jgi:hypothetical protein